MNEPLPPPFTETARERTPADGLRTATKFVHGLSVIIGVLGLLLAIVIVGTSGESDAGGLAAAVGGGLSSVFFAAIGGLFAAYTRWRLDSEGEW